jgi:hypothetical protein
VTLFSPRAFASLRLKCYKFSSGKYQLPAHTFTLQTKTTTLGLFSFKKLRTGVKALSRRIYGSGGLCVNLPGEQFARLKTSDVVEVESY